MAHMDRISHLPDELLLTILSLLPAKNVVVTMVLSKRWKFIWKLVPRLKYDQDGEDMRFSQFVLISLLLHEAPVIETLRFKVLGQNSGSGDIQAWIRAGDKRCVRKLVMESETLPVILHWRYLYTCFRMLVTLKLCNAYLVDDVSSSPFSFPYLKKMSLKSIIYQSDEFVNKLLSSSCPVLEELVVKQCPEDNVAIMSIRFPSLKRLFLRKSEHVRDNAHGFVIDAPSLEFLDIVDYSRGCRIVENNMCKIETANLDISYAHTRQLLGFLTSAKLFFLCLPGLKNTYPVGSVFCSLVHLRLCTCESKWLYVLMVVLRDSPKLQYLELNQYHPLRDGEPRPSWSEPISVPQCLLSSLETFKWVDYEGTKEEKEVVGFILRNGSCLTKATISSKSTDPEKKLEMMEVLLSLSTLSPTCHLLVK